MAKHYNQTVLNSVSEHVAEAVAVGVEGEAGGGSPGCGAVLLGLCQRRKQVSQICRQRLLD